MHSTLLFAFAALLVSVVQAAKPPRDVAIIYPGQNIGINVGQNITYGAGEYGTYYGLSRNMTAYLVAPNGSFVGSVGTEQPDPLKGVCFGSNTTVTTEHRVNMFGTWMVMLQVRYGVSSDPSKVNETYCGPGPFSYETWAINATFNVIELKQNISALPMTLSTQLPSQPTGSVKTAASAHTRAYLGWTAILVALALSISV